MGPRFLFIPPVCESRQFVATQHQGYLFCLVECKVNRRGRAKISGQRERATTAAERQIKSGAERETRESGHKETRREIVKGGGRTECGNRDGLIDGDNEADRSQARLWPIRIKLAGPWKRLGRTVGHE